MNLYVIVQSLESRLRHMSFLISQIIYAMQESWDLSGLNFREGGGEAGNKQRIRRNAIYLLLSSFINLHLSKI
jgi:hypothetical protein